MPKGTIDTGYFSELPEDINIANLNPELFPKHIAVIMDGNGRWAKARDVSRTQGHKAGVKSLQEFITACVKLGIAHVSAYAFSTENWSRPKLEVKALMTMFAAEIEKQMPLLMENGVRLHFLGAIDKLPENVQESFARGIEQTAHNTKLTLHLAVNYGGRQEISHAVTRLARKVSLGELKPEEITLEHIESELDTADIPDPDLLIRTSGEMRISNFLLWQLAYTEFYMTDVLWPDFTRYDLLRALLSYQKRERRFGGLG
ncbi:MAG: isoprenyl transferase [Coriobacteriia bacterium]|nr:isoprenyl transferase [Coriobacteriia bacterium]